MNQYLTITPDQFDINDVDKTIDLYLQVNSSWVDKNAKNKEEVFLYLLENKSWGQQETIFEEEVNNTYYYRVQLANFGDVAISANDKVIVSNNKNEREETYAPTTPEKVQATNESEEKLPPKIQGRVISEDGLPENGESFLLPLLFIGVLVCGVGGYYFLQTRNKRKRKNF